MGYCKRVKMVSFQEIKCTGVSLSRYLWDTAIQRSCYIGGHKVYIYLGNNGNMTKIFTGGIWRYGIPNRNINVIEYPDVFDGSEEVTVSVRIRQLKCDNSFMFYFCPKESYVKESGEDIWILRDKVWNPESTPEFKYKEIIALNDKTKK